MKTIKKVNPNLIKTLDVILYKFIIVPPAIAAIVYFILEFFHEAMTGRVVQDELMMMAGFSALCIYVIYMGYKLVFCQVTDRGLKVKGYLQSQEIPQADIRAVEVSPGFSNTQFVYVKLHRASKFGTSLWLLTRADQKVVNPKNEQSVGIVELLKSLTSPAA